jgi:hypothetical protein
MKRKDTKVLFQLIGDIIASYLYLEYLKRKDVMTNGQ